MTDTSPEARPVEAHPTGGAEGRQASPSEQAVRREQSVFLADALERLPDDYREVLILRHLEELPFPVIADRMGRSLDSVKKLWARGLACLRDQVEAGQ